LPAEADGAFAAEVSSERLIDKKEVGGVMVYAFRQALSEPHDWGDALAIAFMGGAWRGIGTGGQVVRPVRRVVVRDRNPMRVASVEMEV